MGGRDEEARLQEGLDEFCEVAEGAGEVRALWAAAQAGQSSTRTGGSVAGRGGKVGM